jgi:hypothetical protein
MLCAISKLQDNQSQRRRTSLGSPAPGCEPALPETELPVWTPLKTLPAPISVCHAGAVTGLQHSCQTASVARLAAELTAACAWHTPQAGCASAVKPPLQAPSMATVTQADPVVLADPLNPHRLCQHTCRCRCRGSAHAQHCPTCGQALPAAPQLRNRQAATPCCGMLRPAGDRFSRQHCSRAAARRKMRRPPSNRRLATRALRAHVRARAFWPASEACVLLAWPNRPTG